MKRLIPIHYLRNFIPRHWHGQYPLAQSLWINAVLLNISLGLSLGILFWFFGTLGTAFFASSHLLQVAISPIIFLWQWAGVWRSASRIPDGHPHRIWYLLTKGFVILVCLNYVFVTVRNTFPQTLEYVSMLRGDPQLPPFHIRIEDSGRTIIFEGAIRSGSAEDFQHVLDANPHIVTLEINSPGGRLSEAQQMAELVRHRGLDTNTSDDCESAATIVFLAGKKRSAGPHAHFGFHSPVFPGGTFFQQRLTEWTLERLMRTDGVSEFFIRETMNTRGTSVWHPITSDLIAGGVITPFKS